MGPIKINRGPMVTYRCLMGPPGTQISNNVRPPALKPGKIICILVALIKKKKFSTPSIVTKARNEESTLMKKHRRLLWLSIFSSLALAVFVFSKKYKTQTQENLVWIKEYLLLKEKYVTFINQEKLERSASYFDGQIYDGVVSMISQEKIEKHFEGKTLKTFSEEMKLKFNTAAAIEQVLNKNLVLNIPFKNRFVYAEEARIPGTRWHLLHYFTSEAVLSNDHYLNGALVSADIEPIQCLWNYTGDSLTGRGGTINLVATTPRFHRIDFLGQVSSTDDSPLTRSEILDSFRRFTSHKLPLLGALVDDNQTQKKDPPQNMFRVYHDYVFREGLDGINCVKVESYFTDGVFAYFYSQNDGYYGDPLTCTYENSPLNECNKFLSDDNNSNTNPSFLSCIKANLPKDPLFLASLKNMEAFLATNMGVKDAKLSFLPAN